MTTFWAQIIAALVGALATGGVRLLGQHLQRRFVSRPGTDNRSLAVAVDDDD